MVISSCSFAFSPSHSDYDTDTEELDALNLTAHYLSEIGQYPLLSAEQERALASRIAQGEQEALHQLVTCNLRLVVAIAKKYQTPHVALLDLIQEGAFGLLHAAKKFDAARGWRFSTYATWWVRQAIARAVPEQAHALHIPVHVHESIARMRHARQQFYREQQREPTISELAHLLHVPPRQIILWRQLHEPYASLDAPISEQSDLFCLGDTLEDPDGVSYDDEIEQCQLSEPMEHALNLISERERTILIMRYGLTGEKSLSLEETSKHFRVSRERIRQIEVHALTLMRTYLTSPSSSSLQAASTECA